MKLYFDGSYVGLTSGAEDIFAASINPDNSLLISVRDNFSANGIVASAQDNLRFEPYSFEADTANCC